MFSSGKLLASSPSDPYFNYNTLLLKEVGTNGQQNNTFVDGSVNNFTITRNGNSTQGTFAPFGNFWSNYFASASSDYLTVAGSSGNAAFTFGNGDVTIECWVNHTTITGTQNYYRTQSGAANAAYLFRQTNGQLEWAVYNSTGTLLFSMLSAASALTVNTWYHVAAVRNGNTHTIYVNGVASGTPVTASYTAPAPLSNIFIGKSEALAEFMNGYISNHRVVKGTAVYTSNFTPPITPLTAISGTSLLSCQSNRFIDNSTNNFTITPSGSAYQVSRSSPFLGTAYNTSLDGGSGYFDGNGDFLQTPTDTALNFNSVDYTVEGWAYLDMATYSSFDLGGRGIVSDYLTNSSGRWAVVINSSGRLEFAEQNASGATSVSVVDSSAIVLKQWFHFAAVKSGTTMYLFKNGVSVGTNTSAVRTTFGGRINVGQFTIDTNYRSYFLGYISNIRLIKGSALYTSNFTPSTTPLTAVSNTSLLLNFTNSGIYDVSENNTLETVGNAQANTTQSKWGGSSIYFDGNGDCLTIPSNIIFQYGTGNFTIEFWLYSNAFPTTGNYHNLFDHRGGIFTQNQGCLSLYNTGSVIQLWFDFGSTNILKPTYTPSINTWNHIAAVRNSGTLTLYVNGTSIGSTAHTSNYTLVYKTFIGSYDGSVSFFNGYMEDLRVTKGIARYTANFTAPTAPFPTR